MCAILKGYNMKHVSYRGQKIDMDLLRFQNSHQVALGNAQMNARGDILGKGGVIVKTREQQLQEREQALTKPDYNPESQTQSYAPKMETLKTKFKDVDFAADDVQESTDTEEAPAKRAPRKKD